VLGTYPGPPAWLYLAPVGYIVTKLVRLLVVNRFVLVGAEEAHFTSRGIFRSPAPTCAFWLAGFLSGHWL